MKEERASLGRARVQPWPGFIKLTEGDLPEREGMGLSMWCREIGVLRERVHRARKRPEYRRTQMRWGGVHGKAGQVQG